MNFLNLFKKKEKDPLSALEDLNLEDTSNTQNPYLQDQNPMNQEIEQNPNFSQQAPPISNQNQQYQEQQRFDSFGNPIRNPYDSQEQQTYNQQIPQPQGNETSKDIQLILAKLDTIKAEVTNISHRLELLETQLQTKSKQQQPRQGRYVW